ncbi:phage tail tube protein [Lactococcus garvieae]|uniref:phage tail tube protein n=1 Tax=Lactococcus garvieae TaxID=1363 RepID=UPI001F622FBE|nr:phage tail tube protein [Lactococcus garvieae]MCI3860138.1 phage tail tube protein [Lactococcus garvieae]
MATLNYADVLALSEGTIFVTMDGKNIPLIEVEEATASIEFNKEDVFALGKRFKGSKVTSATGKGKMTSYFMRSTWNELIQEYKNSGYLPRMTMTATMEDKSSTLGKQVVTISNFMPDKVDLFMLKADDGIAENEMDFTFDDFALTESFAEMK